MIVARSLLFVGCCCVLRVAYRVLHVNHVFVVVCCVSLCDVCCVFCCCSLFVVRCCVLRVV